MAWNESGNGKNPWDRGGGNEGPPDLDKIVRDWQKRFNALFGGRGGDKGGGSGAGASSLAGILVLALIAWAATGLYRVDDPERGVILRFGKVQDVSLPGLRWHFPWPIETVEKVNINAVNRFNQQTFMLTSDENIIAIDLVVQYRNADPEKYLFNVRDPDATLGDVSESAIREIIGSLKMDYILGVGRADIAQRTQTLIQETLDEYGTGVVVTKVNLQNANFPSQVEGAVQDAIKAREDKQRLAFEAQSYANDIVPRARGEATRRIQDAEAHKSRVVADAEGEASRFEQLLKEYKQAPDVTRERLYIEAIEGVFRNSNKVILDTKGSGNILYLPIDKMMERSTSFTAPGTASGGARSKSGPSASVRDTRQRDELRTRGSR